jgi:hypothetical protein
LTASETRRALAYWSQSVTGGEGTVLEQEAQRGISLSRTMGGMGRIDGWLTPNRLSDPSHHSRRSDAPTIIRGSSDRTAASPRRPRRPGLGLLGSR